MLEEEIILKGDRKIASILSLEDKALRINLNDYIYGTFAEIGAGQETVRYFFRTGGSSKTIAKAMSAYDKDFSDAIYGIEDDGRYVAESRLKKMLSHEIRLIEQRLDRAKHPNKMFFSFANTVATIDFAKKFKGHGWVGIRYQIEPNQPYNEIVLHIRFKETDVRLQQETLGILGVNLIYGAFHQYNKPKKLLKHLYDHLDNKNGMTEAVMFNPQAQNILPANALYRKNILALRGSFRPVTKVNMTMYQKSYQMFLNEKKVDKDNTIVVFEITLSNLRSEGEIDEKDFLDRAELLCSLGQNVMISNFQEYYKVVEYFSEYTKEKIGIAMGVPNMIDIFDQKYYRHLSGGILEAFGKLFFRDLKIFLYPMLDKNGEVINSDNLKVHPRMKELYKFFKFNGKVTDIDNYQKEDLSIFSRQVLRMIYDKESGWEEMLPAGISEIIKEKGLFGWKNL